MLQSQGVLNHTPANCELQKAWKENLNPKTEWEATQKSDPLIQWRLEVQ